MEVEVAMNSVLGTLTNMVARMKEKPFASFATDIKLKMATIRATIEGPESNASMRDIAERSVTKMNESAQHIAASLVELVAMTSTMVTTAQNLQRAALQGDTDSEEIRNIDDILTLSKRLDRSLEDVCAAMTALTRDADTLTLALLPIDNIRPC